MKMSVRTKMNLLELSFKQCMAITSEDVSYMLSAFPNCIAIDLTGIHYLYSLYNDTNALTVNRLYSTE